MEGFESEHTWEVPLDSEGKHWKRTAKRFGNGLTEFVVSYFYLSDEGEKILLVTYDTAHGFPHRDLRYLERNHKKRKTVNYAHSLEDALKWAEEDLERNWGRYFEEFTKNTEGKNK